MYNLIEYSRNYRTTTGCLWNHYRYDLRDDTYNNNNNNNNNPNKNVINSESFKYKTSITRSIYTMSMEKPSMQEGMKLIIWLMMRTNLVKKKLKLLFH